MTPKRHRRSGSRWSGLVLPGVVLALMAASVALGLWLAPDAAPAPESPDRARLVVLATVVEVPDAQSVRVQAGADQYSVMVAGIKAPIGFECGAEEALARAREGLLGKPVTLVPEPMSPSAGTHVVLRTQSSWTDTMLREGFARVAPGTWTYRVVFEEEEREAERNEAGLWREGSCFS